MMSSGSPKGEAAQAFASLSLYANNDQTFTKLSRTAQDARETGTLEALEDRKLLSSVAMENGNLVIYGNKSSANKLGVYKSGSNYVAVHNGQTRTIKSSSVHKIIIHGSSKNDNIYLTADVWKPSVIKGYKGNDTISGGSAGDWVYGGDGNDKIYGNAGNDFLYGEDGDDQLWGFKGKNKLDGGPGSDKLEGKGSSSSSNNNSNDDNGGGSTPNSNASSPSPRIKAQRTSIMAGQAIHVDGTGSKLGTGSPQNALFHWDFGDGNGSYNDLDGFNAAHFYDKSGTYKITLTITNQAGKRSSSSITVKVSANTRDRLYVSESGSDSNPGTQSRPIKSWSRAVKLVRSNTEVLFRRGDTFDAYDTMTNSYDNVVVGAYGSGSNPVINWRPNVSGYPTIISPKGDDVTIQGLTFTSSSANPPQAIRPIGNNITVRGNTFKTLGYAVNANGNPNGLLVQGNAAPDVGGIESYFIWGQGTDHVYLGNKVANSREEHAIRVVGADRVLIWGNDLTNSTGKVSGDNTPKGTLTLHKGTYFWVARNQLNEGPVAIGPLGNGDGMSQKDQRFTYGVIDGNTLDTNLFVDHGAEHIMVRNNIVKENGGTAIVVEGYNSQYGRTTRDVTIVNNTGYNNSSGGRFIEVQNGADGVILANNLYVAPKLFAGAGATASVYVDDKDLSSFKWIGNNVWAKASSNLWASGGQNYVWDSWSNAAGYKSESEWNKLGAVGTDIFSDVSVSSGFKPSSSSVAAKAAEWFGGVFHDRYGNTRSGSTWSAGAIEV
jgi:hypothetical protein